MANLSLRIKADFDEASRQFKALGEQVRKLQEESLQLAAAKEQAGCAMQMMATVVKASSTAYSKLHQDIGGARNELSAGLIPEISEVTRRVANFIANINNLAVATCNASTALAALTDGVNALKAIAKLPEAIASVTAAVKALNAVLSKNKFGLIAAGVALLITALILLKKNWDVVQTYLQQGIAGLVFAFQTAASAIRMALTVAFNAVKLAGVTVLDFIVGNLMRTLGAMLNAVGTLVPAARSAANAVNAIGDGIGNLREQTRRNADEAIQNAADERRAAQETHRARLNNINEESQARREALRQRETGNEAYLDGARATAAASLSIAGRTEEELTALLEKSLRDRIALLGQTEAQMEAARQNAFTQFMRERLEAEDLHGQARLEFLRQQAAEELDSEKFSYEERLSAKRAFDEMILAEEQELKEARSAIRQEEVKHTAALFGNMSNLATSAGKENVAAAIAGRALSAVQAAINTKLAFTRALATVPFPANKIAAASVLASGMAQKVRILSTPIPSAETGGRFIVPNTTSRVDGVGLRVNPGERIDVSPAGESGSSVATQIINLVFDNQTLATAVNKLIRSGKIELDPFGNLQAATR